MQNPPEFDFGQGTNQLFTLVISSLDSNYNPETRETIHYGISNINTIQNSSDTWCKYLPPIPAKGSGYHRLVANVYHQKEKIEVSHLTKIEKDNLIGRNFSSETFLKSHQDNITPSAFSFVQGNIIQLILTTYFNTVRWDESVRHVFHEVLNMPEPVFEYEHKEVFPIVRPEGFVSI